jgi:hypothetical protein
MRRDVAASGAFIATMNAARLMDALTHCATSSGASFVN